MKNLIVRSLNGNVVEVKDVAVKTFLEGHEIAVAVHDGMFHADDVFSIALMKIYNQNIKIVRRIGRNELKEYVDDNRFVKVDIGNSMFDHHFDNTLRDNKCPYASLGKIFNLIWSELGLNEKWAKKFDNDIIQNIDYTDNNGLDKAIDNGYDVAYSRIVMSFNEENVNSIKNTDKFYECVKLATTILENLIKKYIRDQRMDNEVHNVIEKWKSEHNGNAQYIVLEKFIPTMLFRDTEVQFVIFKNKDQWNLNSIDSKKWLVNENATTGRKFIHANKFMAAYDTEENAIEAAKISIELQF